MIAAAVTAAAGFGAADWLGGAATTRPGSVRRVLLVSEPVAALILLAALVVTPGRLSAAACLVGLAAGLAAGIGQGCLYTALATGPAALAAPVCGIVSIAVPVTYAALDGDPLHARQWAGTALVAVAIVVLCGISTRTDPPAAEIAATVRDALRGLLSRADPLGGSTGPASCPAPAAAPAPVGPPVAVPGYQIASGPLAYMTTIGVLDRRPPVPAPAPAPIPGPGRHTLPPRIRGQARDVVLAVAAGVGFGAYTIVLGHAPPESSLWPVVLAHAALAAAVLGLLLAPALTRPSHRHPPRSGSGAPAIRPAAREALGETTAATAPAAARGAGWALGWSAAVGVAEAVAAAAILLAARADIAVTAAIVAAHPAVTVLLARYLGRQQLGVTRGAGLLLTCLGLLLLAG